MEHVNAISEFEFNESSVINMSMTSTEICSPVAPPYSPISNNASQVSCLIPSPCSPASDSELDTLGSMTCFQAPAAFSTPMVSVTKAWHGFKIVMDNIDMNIRPRHQTLEHRTKSLHYVNTYAVRDRIDLSQLQHVEHRPDLDPNMLDLYEKILPSSCDHERLLNNMAILVGRILVEAIPALSKIPGLTTDHIAHPYSKEMSSKSEVVSV